MLRFFALFLVSNLFMLSCSTTTEKYYTQAQIDEIVDSIMEIRTPQIKQQAEENFKLRMSIELKPKVDSILNRTNIEFETPQMEEAELESIEIENYD